MTKPDFLPGISQLDLAQKLIERSENQIFVIDLENKYLYFNLSFHLLLKGCLGEDLYAQLGAGDSLPKEFLKAGVQKAIKAACMGNSSQITEEFGNYRIKKVWLEMQVAPFFGPEGLLVGISFFCKDVSQKVRYEKDLLAAKEAALADARAKSAFLSNMSHEIRTPMNAIIGLTELLLKKKMDDNSLENLKAIQFSANNLLTIINDILDFSKIEAGKFNFDIHVFDIFQVLEEINKGIRVSAQQKNLLYEIQLNGSIPKYMKGDSVRLAQILVNLLGNSVKFTQTGKIRLSVDVLHDLETEIILEFKVSDTGIGIPKDRLPTIFQTFNQVHSQNKYKTQGTGLGLSISKKLVDLQDGEISVQSEIGKGSVFTFFLPFLKAGAKDLEPSSNQDEDFVPLFKDVKVLLVEDNKINQLLAKQILTGWGVNVEVANDGFEAIAKLQRRSFDLILLDLQMPEIDGFEVARFVRTTVKPPDNAIPIVALTADVFAETRALTLEAGMNDYITKPYQQKDLLRVLKKFTLSDEQFLRPEVEVNLKLPEKSIDFHFIKEKFGKDQDTFRYILEIFKNEIGQELDSIRSLLKKNETHSSIKPVHKLVSTFTAMGMPETAFTLSLMERMLKQNDDAHLVLEKLEEVNRHYQQALLQIEPVLESLK
jgi:signal transduction histidine kinase/CheY-like chemotaxis protein